jgi:hypothetical protein
MSSIALAAVAALGLVVSAQAGTWWVLESANGSCVTSQQAVKDVHDADWVSPFTLAAEMRQQGS